MISADFIFSLTLCAGLCIVLFSLTFTLSMAEVGQYIAFSASRAHAAAHVDPAMQAKMGTDKFNELLSKPVLQDLFAKKGGGSWFLLGAETDGSAPKIDIKGGYNGEDFSNIYSIPKAAVEAATVPITGVRVAFVPRILNLKIAFLGTTASDSDSGFKSYLTAFMIREPSQQECLVQMKARNEAILNLSSRYKTLGSSGNSKYVPLEDNGC
ncbi:hypothetical protein [Bdellovibrio sp. NC01]|uniref:hypothetical protein n=1 Tax=Bdellovibrio sp. NC01 TaxID=2220073 RepID=UPI00115ACD8E|nr:hypothetical protein [Bdellovibrio sp. NC01]QDK36200.1 hypothetical protein DOE51_00580 [Bdellovibrio sp. NC01]